MRSPYWYFVQQIRQAIARFNLDEETEKMVATLAIHGLSDTMIWKRTKATSPARQTAMTEAQKILTDYRAYCEANPPEHFSLNETRYIDIPSAQIRPALVCKWGCDRREGENPDCKTCVAWFKSHGGFPEEYNKYASPTARHTIT